MITSAEAFAS